MNSSTLISQSDLNQTALVPKNNWIITFCHLYTAGIATINTGIYVSEFPLICRQQSFFQSNSNGKDGTKSTQTYLNIYSMWLKEFDVSLTRKKI